MRDLDGLTATLGIRPPWYVTGTEVDPASRRLLIGLAYADGSTFACPRCGAADCAVELDWPRTWSHPSFLGYRTYVLTRLPDLGCDHCGIVPAAAAWEGHGFALLTLPPESQGLAQWSMTGPGLADAGRPPVRPLDENLVPIGAQPRRG